MGALRHRLVDRAALVSGDSSWAVLSAIAWSIVIPVQQSVIAEAAGSTHLGRRLSLYEAACLVGAIIGSLAAGLLYESGSRFLACTVCAAIIASGAVLVPAAVTRLDVVDRAVPMPRRDDDYDARTRPGRGRSQRHQRPIRGPRDLRGLRGRSLSLWCPLTHADEAHVAQVPPRDSHRRRLAQRVARHGSTPRTGVRSGLLPALHPRRRSRAHPRPDVRAHAPRRRPRHHELRHGRAALLVRRLRHRPHLDGLEHHHSGVPAPLLTTCARTRRRRENASAMRFRMAHPMSGWVEST